MSAWERVTKTVAPNDEELVARTVTHWKQDADLGGIRDDQERGKLPDQEQAAFAQFWDDVDGLLAKLAGRK